MLFPLALSVLTVRTGSDFFSRLSAFFASEAEVSIKRMSTEPRSFILRTPFVLRASAAGGRLSERGSRCEDDRRAEFGQLGAQAIRRGFLVREPLPDIASPGCRTRHPSLAALQAAFRMSGHIRQHLWHVLEGAP